VTLKEENPLWYAPREYFLKRSMAVPEEGSRERFKRAALGSKTIFLNNHTPIHSGPVWMQEIGGIRLSTAEMQQVFSTITVGTRVEVR
jgi:lipoprotein-anchoring transpeptidase ErfK/SrfK